MNGTLDDELILPEGDIKILFEMKDTSTLSQLIEGLNSLLIFKALNCALVYPA